MDSDSRNRVLNQAIIAEALSWQGTPWLHQARIKGVGVDCLMFLAEVYERAGMTPHADPRPYPRDWHMHRTDERFIDGVRGYADEVDTPEPGDIAVFRFGRCYAHGAIVLEWPRVIHAYIGHGVRQADASTGVLSGRAVKFFRVKQQ